MLWLNDCIKEKLQQNFKAEPPTFNQTGPAALLPAGEHLMADKFGGEREIF
jgi:hypothetical protein